MLRHSLSLSLVWLLAASFIVAICLPFQLTAVSQVNLPFSIKSSIEQFHKSNGLHKSSIKSHERYSAPEESRAVVEMESIYGPLEQFAGVTSKPLGDHKSYHFDTKADQWLKLAKGQCSVPRGGPSQELEEELFGDEIAQFIRNNPILKAAEGHGRTKHIIGAAKLLMLLEHLPKLVANEPSRIIRGVEATVYRVKLEAGEEDGCPGFNLTAAYRQSRSMSRSPQKREIPWHLEISCADTLLIVNFYDYRSLDNLANLDKTMTQSTVSYRDDLAFVFPLEVGCANALVHASRQQQQQDDGAKAFFDSMISKVSFKAKITDNLKARARETNAMFAFDLRAKLLRKDSIQQDSVEDQQILSTTVYDFEQNKKYHSFTRSQSSRNTTTSMMRSLGSQGSTAGSGCFVGQIRATSGNDKPRTSNNHLSKFINFERLVFMGRVGPVKGIGGAGAKIYVEDGPDQLPFWLAPSVVLKRGAHDDDETTMSPNVTKLDSYNFDPNSNSNSNSGQILLIYYFADEYDDEASNEPCRTDDKQPSLRSIQLGQLLRLEVLVKDSARNILFTSQSVEFSDFRWNQLGRGTANTFSLSRVCSPSSPSPSTDYNKLDFAILLVPEARALSKEDSEVVEKLIFNQIARNELIIEALESEFRLPKIYVDQVSSKLLRSNNNNNNSSNSNSNSNSNERQALQKTFRMPSIGFDVKLANLKHNDPVVRQVHWVALGLGQFMDRSQLRRSDVLNLEECLWSALHYSQLVGEDVLVAYKQSAASGAGANAQECLIDKLYKWRDLQHHEAKIADMSRVRNLNYFPYEYGEHFMYKVTLTESNDSDSDDVRLRTSLLLNSKPLSQIGRRVTLPMLDNDPLGIQFIVKHLSMSGSISEFENLATTSRAKIRTPKIIDRVAWHRSNGDDKSLIKSASLATTSATIFNNLFNLDGSRQVEKRNLPSSEAAEDDVALRPLMTLSLCRSMCLLDSECKSYSYCEASNGLLQSNSDANDCKLSLIDIESGQIADSIRDLVNKPPSRSSQERDKQSLAKRQAPIRRISIDIGDTTKQSAEISVRMNARCSIYSKSYGDLFAKSVSKEIVPIEFVRHQQVVKDVNDCARRCFERNRNYSRGSVEHKLNLTVVESEIKEQKQAQQQQSGAPISEQKLESLFDWHARNVKSLCVYFYYSAGKSTDTDPSAASANSSCLLSTDLNSRNAEQQRPPPLPARQQQEGPLASRMMDLHKLIYANLFERMSGFRLAATMNSESEAASSNSVGAGGESAAVESYKLLLISHQIGLNRQVQVNLDDIEYCARACILQTHGPRPACSSFDFVYERRAQGHKYCMLNSQSLNDLNRHRLIDGGVNNRTTNPRSLLVFAENEDQFWHFEPRDSLLRPIKVSAGMDETDRGDLDEVWRQFLNKNLVSPEQKLFDRHGGAFERISLLALLTILGVASGLLLGAKLARVWIRRTRDESEEANFMNRLVHRLSGVSISSRLQEGEVWM